LTHLKTIYEVARSNIPGVAREFMQNTTAARVKTWLKAGSPDAILHVNFTSV